MKVKVVSQTPIALLTADGVAEILQISTWRVHNLARQRQLRCVLLSGRERRFRLEDVERFIAERVSA
ncbi:helix-turn-helix domain-containing protein [Gordonia polyisoprenivorans]|uniref:Helix-turn-helix domain-containing protein n=1 Tax=Gordonia polyisoprenivorans TaxID=84595 RepID=A0A846WS11_9ACTN|nr:helix-turn-helix domain-containing protein [Gordonia polyisoprenivorans]